MQNRKTLTICINMGSVSAGLSDKFLLNLIKFFRFLGGQYAPEYQQLKHEAIFFIDNLFCF